MANANIRSKWVNGEVSPRPSPFHTPRSHDGIMLLFTCMVQNVVMDKTIRCTITGLITVCFDFCILLDDEDATAIVVVAAAAAAAAVRPPSC